MTSVGNLITKVAASTTSSSGLVIKEIVPTIGASSPVARATTIRS